MKNINDPTPSASKRPSITISNPFSKQEKGTNTKKIHYASITEIPLEILKTVSKQSVLKIEEVIASEIIEDLVEAALFSFEENSTLCWQEKSTTTTIQIQFDTYVGKQKIVETKSITMPQPEIIEFKPIDSKDEKELEGPTFTYNYEQVGLGERFFAAMTVYNDEVHQIDILEGRDETKGEVLAAAVCFAAKLHSIGFKESDIIVICSRCNNIQTKILLGSLLIGAIVAPLDPNLTTTEYVDLIQKLQPKIVFCDLRTKGLMEFAKALCGFTKMEVLSLNQDPAYNQYFGFVDYETFKVPKIENLKEKIAFIVPTMGTAGPIKICSITHYAMAVRSLIWKNTILKGCRKVVSWFPLSWFMHLMVQLCAFELPITIVHPSAFTERSACKTICDHKIDRVFLGIVYSYRLSNHVARLFPSSQSSLSTAGCSSDKIEENLKLKKVRFFEPLKDYDIGCIRAIIIGGACTNPTILNKIWRSFNQVRIMQCYGLTETGIISLNTLNDLIRMDKQAHSAGLVISGCAIKVVDIITHRHLQPNSIGLILIKCEGMMEGYFKNEKLTKAKLDSSKYLNTEDTGYYNLCGHLLIKGRVHDILHKDGKVYSTSDVDEFISRHPYVANVVTVTDGKEVVSYVVLKKTKRLAVAEFYSLMEKCNFPPELIPKWISFKESFPTTTIGKFKKYILRDETFLKTLSRSGMSLEQISP